MRRAAPLSLLAAAIFIVAALLALFQPFHGGGEGRVVVKVPRGSGVGEIADLLDDRGVVSSSFLFEVRVSLAGKRSDIQAGTYVLERGMSYAEAIDALTADPEEDVVRVTIPEGLSRREVAPIVEKAGVRGDYLAASRSHPDLDPSRYGAKGARSLEGFLFPATYELRRGATARDLVRRQTRAFRDAIAKVRMRYARSKNLNDFDVITIASMIDREVRVPSERRKVAAVIYNRLKAQQPLGIDATVRYAVRNWERPLTSAELATDTPYNTRRRAGLPPGPIGSPGLAALKAAANPVRRGYLYYVVKPGTCGEHVFARTEVAFERARRRYNRARDQAGGRSPTTCPD